MLLRWMFCCTSEEEDEEAKATVLGESMDQRERESPMETHNYLSRRSVAVNSANVCCWLSMFCKWLELGDMSSTDHSFIVNHAGGDDEPSSDCLQPLKPVADQISATRRRRPYTQDSQQPFPTKSVGIQKYSMHDRLPRCLSNATHGIG